MASRVNLPRPPFVTTSWLVIDCVIIWIIIDYTDFRLPRGSKIRALLDYGFRCCPWAAEQAGLRPGGPGPPTAWVPPSRAEGGKSSRVQPAAATSACRTVSGEVRWSCPTAFSRINVKSRLVNLVLLPLRYGNKDIIRDNISECHR